MSFVIAGPLNCEKYCKSFELSVPNSSCLLAPRVRDAVKSVVLPSLSVLNVELKDIR